ncbi:MAG: hypothetical protein AB1758_08430 [Candidatus Eremiobacterota bacterium]
MKSRETRRSSSTWKWVTMGIGAGLLLTVLIKAGYDYMETRRSRDPRATKVQELIEEAERLLAQGRRAGVARRRTE